MSLRKEVQEILDYSVTNTELRVVQLLTLIETEQAKAAREALEAVRLRKTTYCGEKNCPPEDCEFCCGFDKAVEVSNAKIDKLLENKEG